MEPLQARLVNAGGELIAEGPCWLNEAAGEATMEPEREPGVLQKERGELALALEGGRSYRVSDKPIIFRLRPPTRLPGRDGVRTLYRLRLIDSAQEVLPEGRTAGAGADNAQEAKAAGAVGEGAPAPRHVGGPRFDRETPAAR